MQLSRQYYYSRVIIYNQRPFTRLSTKGLGQLTPFRPSCSLLQMGQCFFAVMWSKFLMAPSKKGSSDINFSTTCYADKAQMRKLKITFFKQLKSYQKRQIFLVNDLVRVHLSATSSLIFPQNSSKNCKNNKKCIFIIFSFFKGSET